MKEFFEGSGVSWYSSHRSICSACTKWEEYVNTIIDLFFSKNVPQDVVCKRDEEGKKIRERCSPLSTYWRCYCYPSKLCRIQFFGGERGCNFVKKSREVYDHSNEHLSPLQSSCKMAYQNPCTFGILISTLSLSRVWTWLPKKNEY